MRDNTLSDKSICFAARILKLHKYLIKTQKETIISKQIVRSGTSIGANIAEAIYGSSRRDFVAKLQIALKECAETAYWLELLHSCDYISDQMYRSLSVDCEELRKILSSFVKSSQ